MAKKKKTGKSTYDPKYIQEMLDFFDRPHQEEIVNEDGSIKIIGNKLPFFSAFARKIGTTTKTLLDWCEDNPEFAAAHHKCKEMQVEMLVNNGLRGLYSASFATFTAKNIAGMRDEVHADTSEEARQITHDQAKQIVLIHAQYFANEKHPPGEAKYREALERPPVSIDKPSVPLFDSLRDSDTAGLHSEVVSRRSGERTSKA